MLPAWRNKRSCYPLMSRINPIGRPPNILCVNWNCIRLSSICIIWRKVISNHFANEQWLALHNCLKLFCIYLAQFHHLPASSSPAAPSATPKSSPPPTNAASPWSSPACATSGTESGLQIRPWGEKRGLGRPAALQAWRLSAGPSNGQRPGRCAAAPQSLFKVWP